jgi:hypothetical protein
VKRLRILRQPLFAFGRIRITRSIEEIICQLTTANCELICQLTRMDSNTIPRWDLRPFCGPGWIRTIDQAGGPSGPDWPNFLYFTHFSNFRAYFCEQKDVAFWFLFVCRVGQVIIDDLSQHCQVIGSGSIPDVWN